MQRSLIVLALTASTLTGFAVAEVRTLSVDRGVPGGRTLHLQGVPCPAGLLAPEEKWIPDAAELVTLPVGEISGLESVLIFSGGTAAAQDL